MLHFKFKKITFCRLKVTILPHKKYILCKTVFKKYPIIKLCFCCTLTLFIPVIWINDFFKTNWCLCNLYRNADFNKLNKTSFFFLRIDTVHHFFKYHKNKKKSQKKTFRKLLKKKNLIFFFQGINEKIRQ